MKHTKLVAEARTILGKQVKKLRRDGILPANIYGKELASTAVQVDMKAFKTIYAEVGETGLVDVELSGKTRPVLIKNVHMNYHMHMPLHADFYQVNLKEKVKTMVPLVIVGEPSAVTEKIGLMLQTLNEVEVEALPEELPESIEVQVEHLAAIDEQLTVADLKAGEGVTILTDPAQTVVKIAELVVEEPEEEVPAEGEAGAETTTEGEEGEKAEGGEEKSEESTEDKKEESKE
ncbi:50S ribosomal protein L25/general stress protein Ctc [soil metagenome]